MDTLADKLKQARMLKKLTLKELADLSELKFRQVCRYEQGTAFPRPKAIRQLANALGVSESYLDVRGGRGKKVTWEESLDRKWASLKKFDLSAIEAQSLHHYLELLLKSKQLQSIGTTF